MKNLLNKVLDALNINGRDWIVMLSALLLAFSIWMIHNLSLKYNDYLSVTVTARCDIDGHSAISSDRCEVIARCRTTGYKVIRSAMKKGNVTQVRFRPEDMHRLEGDEFYVTASSLLNYANAIFGPDVSVDYFLKDTLFFRFPYENSKKVPVVPIYSFKYKDQYMPDGELRLDPDSVLVYGEPYLIENVDFVYTKPLRRYDISDGLSGMVDVEPVSGARVSVGEVHYELDVKRYVEMSSTIAVTPVNVPSGKTVTTYPSVVHVSLRCNFPLVDDPFDGLVIEADYNDIQKSLKGGCILKPSGLSRGVIDYEISPISVSCILEDSRQ